MSYSEITAAAGGLLGLGFGFSILSAAEFFYFLFFRWLYYRYYQKKQQQSFSTNRTPSSIIFPELSAVDGSQKTFTTASLINTNYWSFQQAYIAIPDLLYFISNVP